MLKYLDLHNKILRDAVDPETVAQELLDNGYYVVGVNAHNSGNEVKDKKHYYKFFETHFEMFAERGLLMLPAVELKVRGGNYEDLPIWIKDFSRKFIPIHHKGEVYHVPFMIFVHGGEKEVDLISVCMDHLDLLCHPKKGEGYFNLELAKTAAEHDVGVEINYREYMIAEDKKKHLEEVKELLRICKKAKNKVFMFTATIKKEELTHIKELVTYANKLHEDLIRESVQNVHELLMVKYGKLMGKIEYSLDTLKQKHGL